MHSTMKCSYQWCDSRTPVIAKGESTHVYIKRVPNWHDFFSCEIMCIIMFTFHKFEFQNILLMLNIISQWSYHLTQKKRQNSTPKKTLQFCKWMIIIKLCNTLELTRSLDMFLVDQVECRGLFLLINQVAR